MFDSGLGRAALSTRWPHVIADLFGVATASDLVYYGTM